MGGIRRKACCSICLLQHHHLHSLDLLYTTSISQVLLTIFSPITTGGALRVIQQSPAMSTTATTSKQALDHVLADYEIRLTGTGAAAQGRISPEAVSPLPEVQRDANTPPDWPTDHRRVPPYRPIDHSLDPAERIVYSNGVERAFITTMFFGLRLITVRLVSPACEKKKKRKKKKPQCTRVDMQVEPLFFG